MVIAPYKCIVAANGSFPVLPLALDLIRDASVLIACDGAAASLHQRGFVPDAIVGDCDSLPAGLRKLYADRLHIESEQETNDLTKAIRFAYASGHREALIVGATGLREDHTLGNISLLAEYARLLDRVEMLTDYGLLTPILQTTTLSSEKGQQVSLFSLRPDVEISVAGLRWPVSRRKLTAWWQGTLNEALGDTFTVSFDGANEVIIYRSFALKGNILV
ncbi:MAG: thiamine pyrophosphokinase [Bacteroidales bacterium]